MTWTTPATWSAGQLVRASDLNAQVRDNISALMFPNNFVVYNTASAYTTTGTTLSTITAASLTVQAGAPVQFACQLLLSAGGTPGIIRVAIDIDGTPRTVFYGLANNNPPSNVYSTQLFTGLSVGAHTFTLQWSVTNGAGTAQIPCSALPLTMYAIEL